jgi:hypothetical protein
MFFWKMLASEAIFSGIFAWGCYLATSGPHEYQLAGWFMAVFGGTLAVLSFAAIVVDEVCKRFEGR